MLSPDAHVLFCASMSGSKSAQPQYLQHCVTALKFAQKIREAIHKRLAKANNRGRVLNRVGRPDTVLGRITCAIESDLAELKQKLAKTVQQ